MPQKKSEFTDYDLYSDFYALVRQIPTGKVTTYGALARALGDIVAARACGYMLSINPDPEHTPCFKVVKSNGDVWKFTHPLGQEEKIRRLSAEGIGVSEGKISEFERTLFDDFTSAFPLERMREEQESMASSVRIEDDLADGAVAAVDVSYDDYHGYAAMVIEEGGKIDVRRAILPIQFPYIPGYLSYREYKFIEHLARDFEGTLLIDGNGYLHPRRIGLASFAGLMLGLPTIGVAKSILTGKTEGRWIYNADEKSAYIVNNRTIVSAGNRISLDTAVGFLNKKYGDKYPELLRRAHNETVMLRKHGM